MKLAITAILACCIALYAGYHWPVSVPCAGPMDPVNAECGK